MRLIDADALYDELYENMGEDEVLDRIPPCYVDNAHTVDAVPVVRCQKCIFYDPANCNNWCSHPKGLCNPGESDFCSYGKEPINSMYR